jgi:hypothetical protein
MSKRIVIPASVLKKADEDAIKAIQPLAERNITLEFEKIKRQMIQEFLNHPVTREISKGVDSPNYSGTLSHGNLYSFIIREFDKHIIFFFGNFIDLKLETFLQQYFTFRRKCMIFFSITNK